MYLPYLGYKIDVNVGFSIHNQNTYSSSVGVGIFSYRAFNIKEVITFEKYSFKRFTPIFLFQFKYNNITKYNEIEPNPGPSNLYNKNSLIFQPGIQVPLNKSKIKIQFIIGVSYNFTKLQNNFQMLFDKLHNDMNISSVNSIAIIKTF